MCQCHISKIMSVLQRNKISFSFTKFQLQLLLITTHHKVYEQSQSTKAKLAVTTTYGSRLALFSLRESLFCGSGVLAKVRDVKMQEFYAGYRLSSVTILWVKLTKHIAKKFFAREISLRLATSTMRDEHSTLAATRFS